MAWCNTAVSPVHLQWRYCSLKLSHRYYAFVVGFIKNSDMGHLKSDYFALNNADLIHLFDIIYLKPFLIAILRMNIQKPTK